MTGITKLLHKVDGARQSTVVHTELHTHTNTQAHTHRHTRRHTEWEVLSPHKTTLELSLRDVTHSLNKKVYAPHTQTFCSPNRLSTMLLARSSILFRSTMYSRTTSRASGRDNWPTVCNRMHHGLTHTYKHTGVHFGSHPPPPHRCDIQPYVICI